MKPFLKKCSWLLPIPLIVVGTNAWVDPARICGPYEQERKWAQMLLQGRDISISANLEDRILKRYYIAGLTEKKETLVFGSSRSMEIGRELFGGVSLFNNSVFNSSMEDFLAIYGSYRRRELIPRRIVLGLDPWLLNARNNLRRWKCWGDEYEGMLRQLAPAGNAEARGNLRVKLRDLPLENYFTLATPSYFQASLEMLLQQLTGETQSKEAGMRSDGVWIYPEEFSSAGIEEVRRRAEEYLERKPLSSLGGFTALSDPLKSRFARWVDLLFKDNVEVIFFLPPYHPLVYQTMMKSTEYKIIAEVENYFRHLAEAKGIRVVGSYDPVRCGLGEADFYDEAHAKFEAVQRLFQRKSTR